MYSEDNLENEEEVKTSDSFIVNFYNNNKVLVWIFLGIIIFILLMSLLTKGGSNSASKDVKYEVILDPTDSVTIPIGYSKQFTAVVKDYPNEKPVFSIEDETIAKVDNGNVVALSYGTTKLYATYIDSKNNKYTDDCEIIVADGDPNIRLTNVSFKEGDLYMPLNDTYQIALMLTPTRGYVSDKTFTSSNEGVVTVDNTGLVTSVGEGEATIVVNVNDGQFRKELTVYVNSEYTKKEIITTPTKMSFAGELLKMKIGESNKLVLTTVPENADQEKLTWSSSNESVVTVDKGKITAIQEGHAMISVAAVNGVKAEIDVEVESDVIPVTDIDLSTTDIYLTAGQSYSLIPIVTPENASNKALSYASVDSSIATVEPNDTGTSAIITAVRAGTTTIVVTSVEGVEKRVNVTVSGSSIDPTPTDPSTGGNDTTIKVRVDGEMPAKTCSNQTLKYYNNPNITITLNSGVGEIKYCYSTSICEPDISSTTNTAFTINSSGLQILRIKKFDHNGNEITSSGSDNYLDGALEYYINTKGEGTTCNRTTTKTSTPTPTSYRCSMGYNSVTKLVTITGTPNSEVRKTVIDGYERSSVTATRTGTYSGIVYFANGEQCHASKYVTVAGTTPRPATPTPRITATPRVTATPRPTVTARPATPTPVVTAAPSGVCCCTGSKSYCSWITGQTACISSSQPLQVSATASTCASKAVTATSTPAPRGTVSISCTPSSCSANAGESVVLSAVLSTGDTVKEWQKAGSKISGLDGVSSIRVTKPSAGSVTYKVITTRGASATKTVTWTSVSHSCKLMYNSSNRTLTLTASQQSDVIKMVINGRETSTYVVTTNGTYNGTVYYKDGTTCTASNTVTGISATPTPAPVKLNPEVHCAFPFKTSSGYVDVDSITIDSELISRQTLGFELECTSRQEGEITAKITNPSIIGWTYFGGSDEISDSIDPSYSEHFDFNLLRTGNTSIKITFKPKDTVTYNTFTRTYNVTVNATS